jgi:NAD-dependent SIR2 family protein deacetylase
MTTNLDVFDTPVQGYLESYVKNIGHSPSELGPIIRAAISEAKKGLGDSWKTTNDRILRGRIERNAASYMDAVLGQSKLWNECREHIKAYNAVVLAGAGLSYSSDMPLANVLKDMLAFVRARDWAELRVDPNKCLAFKNQFKEICTRKVHNKSHEIVILNFPKYILEILCLNWDDLFEKAAEARGKAINKQNEDHPVTTDCCLWKFHGDVANIKTDNVVGQGGWVFPDEQGYVFNSFKEYVKRTDLKGKFFTFLIVGYGENEKIIKDEIVTLLESDPPRPTYRIVLDLRYLNQTHYIVGTAEYTLSKILPLTKLN